jgi:uncharacterized protein (DUF427 family)
MKAIWHGTVVATSDATLVVEGNHYFPPDAIDKKYFKASKTTTICPWKGQASYYTLDVDGARNEDAAWYYRTPRKAAEEFKDYIGFWRGVEVIE